MKKKCTELFPGITVAFCSENELQECCGAASEDVLELHYCISGRLGRNMQDGSVVCLVPGDLALHSHACCSRSVLTFPSGQYEGMIICMDFSLLHRMPPPLLEDGTALEQIKEKYCKEDLFTVIGEKKEIRQVVEALLAEKDAPTDFAKLKLLELLWMISQYEPEAEEEKPRFQKEYMDTVRCIHDMLCHNLDKRMTIESLAKQFLVNPTTLKAAFKEVYGDSLASHMKEHRMERAAELLVSTEKSVLQIAKEVGYGSQSKFTSAFKEHYGELPTEYRHRK